MPPFSREPGLSVRAKGPGGLQDGHGGPGALVGAGVEFQQVRCGGGRSEGAGQGDLPSLPALVRGTWPRRTAARLGSLTTGRRASLPSRVKAEALGSSREAGPLTLDGGLAGLAHELVDGGQGLWLALEGRTGHVASGLSSPSQCLPVLPQGRPRPQTPHTHLLSSLPLGPRQPLSGRKRRSIWTPWPPAQRAPQPKASCGTHPRSPQRTEDPPLPLREGASLPPGPHPACRPRSAPPRPPEPTSPHLPPTLSVLGRAGGSLGSLPCELSAGLALPTCQSQDTLSGQRGQVCTHVTPPPCCRADGLGREGLTVGPTGPGGPRSPMLPLAPAVPWKPCKGGGSGLAAAPVRGPLPSVPPALDQEQS